MPDAIRLGLIGVGRIGAMHAHNIATSVENATLQAVADIVLENAQQAGLRYNIPSVYDDYRAILSNDQIDAVVVCSATPTHAQIIVEAAEAGKHVFCEKPIDLQLANIDRALSAVRRTGVKLQVGFNRRFDATFARVKTAIVAGEIGNPHLLHVISRDPAPPSLDYLRASGGIFLDMTIHDFDMARFLMGCEAVEVSAAAAVLVDPAIGELGDYDTALTTLRFENGALAVIDNSRQCTPGYDQRVNVLGSKGTVSAENVYPNHTYISRASCVRRDPPYYFFTERYRDSYRLEIAAFVGAILHDTPVPVTGMDGRIPVVLGLAAQRSILEERPVSIDVTANIPI